MCGYTFSMPAQTKSKTLPTASPIRLRDGSWGARLSGLVAPNQKITIQTAGGKTWQATVWQVLWTDDKGSVVTTATGRCRSRADVRASVRYSGSPCGFPGCDGFNYCETCTDDDGY